MPELTIVQQIAIWVLPVLLAVTIHEAAHAWVAYQCGDTTAKMMGRLSFNPLNHLDPIGSVLVPIAVLILSKFTFSFGWAKPVPVNASQMRNPRRGMMLTTAAGPLSNLLMAILWAACLKLALLFIPPNSMPALFLFLLARAGIIINLLLAFFNLIPIPPLDGGGLVLNCLPPKQSLQFQKIEPYGFFILLALMFTGALGWLINPLINGALNLIRGLFSL